MVLGTYPRLELDFKYESLKDASGSERHPLDFLPSEGEIVAVCRCVVYIILHRGYLAIISAIASTYTLYLPCLYIRVPAVIKFTGLNIDSYFHLITRIETLKLFHLITPNRYTDLFRKLSIHHFNDKVLL